MTTKITIDDNNKAAQDLIAVNTYEVTVKQGYQWIINSVAITENLGCSGNVINVDGLIASTDKAIVSSGTNTSFYVAADAQIIGKTGIETHGKNVTINNFGRIEGANYGIFSTGDNFELYNFGQIKNSLVVQGNTCSIFFREGSDSDLVAFLLKAGQSGSLFNSGHIGKGVNGYSVLSSNVDAPLKIINHGTIDGEIYLSGGADQYTIGENSKQGVIYGGLGADSYTMWKDTKIVEKPGEGTDIIFGHVDISLVSINLNGQEIENVTLLDSANINATGNELKNVLIGNAGNNVLDGGAEADLLQGGKGNDTYVVDNVGDVIDETGGDGVDTVRTNGDYSIEQRPDLENVTLTGTGIWKATGNALRNVLVGNAANNHIDGKAGADEMRGDNGDDTYVVDDKNDKIVEAKGTDSGTDTVLSSVSYALSANVEVLELTDKGNINAKGNALKNVLTGNAGNNVLDGAAGADKMTGGAGNDVYYVDNAKDSVTEAKASGSDTVYSKIGWTLGANLEKLVLQGTADLNGKGNALGNTLTGNGGKNTLWGYDNNDTLYGKGGADTLNGGKGNDKLFGDAGADKLIGGADKDDLTGGAGADKLTGGIGNDTFHFAKGLGRDTITDFVANKHDKIDVSSIAAIKNFADIQHMMHQVKEDLVIKITKDDWITLENHHKGDFHAGDFMI